MGGFFGALTGIGQTGEQMAQGKEINRQRQMSNEEFEQKRQEFAAKMAQMQQQLVGLKQQNDPAFQLQQELQKAIQSGQIKSKQDAEAFTQRFQQGKQLGLSGDPLANYVAGRNVESTRLPTLRPVQGKLNGKEFTANYNPLTGKYTDQETGVDVTSQFKQDVKQAAPSVMSMIIKANQGDADAVKALRTYQNMQTGLAEARGEGYGLGRAKWQLNQYTDQETGEPVTLSNYDAVKALTGGRKLMLTGRLPFQTAVAVQQLVSEANPALDGVRSNLGAFDSTQDRAIFARIMEGSGIPERGNESAWMGNVLNQAAISNLSPQGKNLVVSLRRLNETMGRLRSIIGLPATESSMAMTMSLIPGPATPDSKFAGQQIDQLEQIVNQAVQIPAYGRGGIAGKGKGSPQTQKTAAPPPGATMKVPSKKDGKLHWSDGKRDLGVAE